VTTASREASVSILPRQAGTRFANATASVRERAEKRLVAVTSYRAAMAAHHVRIGEAERNWLAGFRQENPGFKISLDSVKRWTERYASQGLDGLIDGNDGHARRGKYSVPRPAQDFFLARYLDRDRPCTTQRAIRETRLAAQEFGWELPSADDVFYRIIKTVSRVQKLARRSAVDQPSKFLPFVARGMDLPYRTLQSDHHIADVFVNCEGQRCEGGKCRQGHRPWWTPMYDVGSRKIISWQISLDVPNAERILRAFYMAILAEGLPARFYCDNGKDFKAATGKGKIGEDVDQSYFSNRFLALGVETVWAQPYNAQAKSIERLFGSFVTRVWQGSEGYVGRLGRRSERSHHLYQNPELLPTFSAFVAELDAEIVAYNNTPHSGIGMRGRTPSQVFAAERIARRDPDPFALALVFWRHELRTLDRNGVRVDGYTYRLVDPDATIHLRYQGERVKILIDPTDVSRALVLNSDEQFLAPAQLLELATHDTRDAVTADQMQQVNAARKALRKQAHAGNAEATFRLRHFYALRPQLLAKITAKHREEEQRLVAAGGDRTTVMLPRYSKIARDVQALSAAPSLPQLTASQSARASEAIDGTDDFLRIAEKSSAHPTPAEDSHYAGERERLSQLRDERRKQRDQICLEPGCETAMQIGNYCETHWPNHSAD
jgi:hypothetical protein